MARETILSQDVKVDQKVYSPNSRTAQSIGAIDRKTEGTINLMFVGFSWYVPVGWPIDVEIVTPRKSVKPIEPVPEEAPAEG